MILPVHCSKWTCNEIKFWPWKLLCFHNTCPLWLAILRPLNLFLVRDHARSRFPVTHVEVAIDGAKIKVAIGGAKSKLLSAVLKLLIGDERQRLKSDSLGHYNNTIHGCSWVQCRKYSSRKPAFLSQASPTTSAIKRSCLALFQRCIAV